MGTALVGVVALLACAGVGSDDALAGLDAVARVRSLSLQVALVASSPEAKATRLMGTIDALEVEHARLQRTVAQSGGPADQASALATELRRFTRQASLAVPGRSPDLAAWLAGEATSTLPARLTALADHFVVRAEADRARRDAVQGGLVLIALLAAAGFSLAWRRRPPSPRAELPRLDLVPFDETMLESLAEPLLLRACLENEPLSLLLVKLDGLDVIGPGRQTVLRTVLLAGRDELRGGDRFLPLEDDRFVALLPATSLAAASRVGRRLRHAVGDLVVVHEGVRHTVHAAVGVATLRDTDHEMTALLRRAHEALARQGHDGVATEPAQRASLRLVSS